MTLLWHKTGATMLQEPVNRLKFLLILLLGGVDALWIALSDFRFGLAGVPGAVLATGLLVAAAAFYRYRRPMQNFEIMCLETAFLLAFSAVGAVFSLLVTSLGLPLVDDRLIRLDAALGFDWMTYVGFVAARPWLQTLSSILYSTTLVQTALVIIALGILGQGLAARRFVSSVMIGCLICIAISGILPAAGALATLKPDAAFMAANNPVVDLAYKQVFTDIRSGAFRDISLAGMHGLIAFPSYHGTLSLLIVIGLWPIRALRWGALALNLAIMAATPVDGGHHLVDVIAGVAVGWVAWALAGHRWFAGASAPAVRPMTKPVLVFSQDRPAQP